MKICTNCKKLFSDESSECSYCKSSLENVTSPDTEIVLLSASGFEKERVEAALAEQGIPYSLAYTGRQPEKMSVSAETADIIVPFSHYAKAVNLCIGIGALDANCTEAQFAEQTNSVSEEIEENMSAAKRTTVKVVSAIAFLLLVALVVFGTDFIMNLIKGLFQ